MKHKVMKNIALTILGAIVLASCGGNEKSAEDIIATGDLEKIRAKRAEVVAQQTEINHTLNEIDQAIARLDTVKKLPLVTAFTAKTDNFDHFLEIQGSVETKQNIVLYPEFSGMMTKVHVREGQKVSKGQLLATIDDGGLGQQLAQLEVQAELAKTTFERQQRLWDEQIGSEIQYLQAKTSYEAQKNAVDQMKKQVAKTRLTAPFSGVIDDVITDQGTVVSAGMTQVMRLVNLSDMYIEADIPETYLGDITVGKSVEVYFPVLGETIEAEVRQVGNYINPSNRTFRMEVTVPNKDGRIKPNLTAKLKINDYSSENAILIPQSVISEDAAGQQYVYVTTAADREGESIAGRVIIKTGKTEGDYVEIKEGLKNGDTIIQEGARSVKDGQHVKILKMADDE